MSHYGDLTEEERRFILRQQEQEAEAERRRQAEQESDAANARKPSFIQLRDYFSKKRPHYFKQSPVKKVEVLYDKLGIFAGAAYTIHLHFENDKEITVTRKEKDFEWLESELIEEMPGIFIKPLTLYTKHQRRYSSSATVMSKVDERVFKGKPFQKYLESILFHPKIPQDATCIWDFFTCTEKEFDEAKKEQDIRSLRQEKVSSLTFQYKKWRQSGNAGGPGGRSALISSATAEQNEKMIKYVRELNKQLKYLYDMIPNYEMALNQLREGFDALGRELKNFGTGDSLNADIFAHVGDQFREISTLERDRRHKKLNLELKFKGTVEFYLELTGSDLLGRFLDRELSARLEQEVLRNELEELVKKQEQLCQKISSQQIAQIEQQEFKDKVDRLLERDRQDQLAKKQADDAAQSAAAAGLDQGEEKQYDYGVVVGAKLDDNQSSKPRSQDELLLEKLQKQLVKHTNLLNRAAQRIWQVVTYKKEEFNKLEAELRSFLRSELVDSFTAAMADDMEPIIEAMGKCRMDKKIRTMIEDLAYVPEEDQ